MKDVSKVVVSLNGSCWIQNHTAKKLHANNGIDEKQHGHQHADIWKSLSVKNWIIHTMNYCSICILLHAASLQKYLAIYYLEWLYEGIKKDSNAYASSQQFYESGCPKKFQKTNRNQLSGINNTSNNGYKIKYVPRIFEVVL